MSQFAFKYLEIIANAVPFFSNTKDLFTYIIDEMPSTGTKIFISNLSKPHELVLNEETNDINLS